MAQATKDTVAFFHAQTKWAILGGLAFVVAAMILSGLTKNGDWLIGLKYGAVITLSASGLLLWVYWLWSFLVAPKKIRCIAAWNDLAAAFTALNGSAEANFRRCPNPEFEWWIQGRGIDSAALTKACKDAGELLLRHPVEAARLSSLVLPFRENATRFGWPIWRIDKARPGGWKPLGQPGP